MLTVLVGVLYASGLYLLLRRSAMRLVLGFVLLGHANNLLLLEAGGVTYGGPPILGDAETSPDALANPLPQALILTAIVIGFALQAFALVLVYRTIRTLGTDDVDRVRAPEGPEDVLASPHGEG